MHKRVNILIRSDQYDRIQKTKIALSSLVRDLLDDRFSGSKVVLTVSDETKDLYEYLISHFGLSDHALEPLFVEALDKFLEQKTGEIKKLRNTMKKGK